MAKERIDLVRGVSRRLLLAMLVLIAAVVCAVVVALWAVEAPSPSVLIVFLAGQIGGYVGLQRRIKKLSTEDLELLATSWVYTVLSPLIGGILAVALYLIFISGLITGELFPVFVADSQAPDDESIRMLFAHHGEKYGDYAKLLVWSFVAGYSEKFVINVISSFTKDQEDA